MKLTVNIPGIDELTKAMNNLADSIDLLGTELALSRLTPEQIADIKRPIFDEEN